MGSTHTLLSVLRSKTTVDCDTLDASVAESLGPFEDCTSNQAIAYAELLHTKHDDLIRKSVRQAQELSSRFPGIKLEALAVEICMVNLGLLIVPHLEGRIHIQANPFDAYDTSRTIASSHRIIEIFDHLQPGLKARDRVCIKIPSTWEGLQACRVLEKEGISTLATTLFSLEQAALAAEVGCLYIAPYVNELAVHFEKGFVDKFPNSTLCVQAQLYYQKFGYARTSTLPASLISTSECMSLAGVKHITIAPALLRALNDTKVVSDVVDKDHASLFEDPAFVKHAEAELPAQPLNLLDDEKKFTDMFAKRDGGRQLTKQVKAIKVFSDMQVKLEEIVGQHLK